MEILLFNPWLKHMVARMNFSASGWGPRLYMTPVIKDLAEKYRGKSARNQEQIWAGV